MKKINFRNIIIFLVYLMFFLFLLQNSFHYLDPDFGWHLKAGEEVSLTGKVPSINNYNYVFPKEENFWVNHEWLSDYLSFLIFKNFGYIVLNIIFALLILLALIIVNNFIVKNLTKNKDSIYLLFILEVLGLIAMAPHLGIRVQEISILFLLLTLIIIFYFENKSLKNNKKSWKNLLWLIPLFYLWANLHAGFLLGIFILFFYLGVKIAESIIDYYKNKKIINFLYKMFDFKNILKNIDLKNFFVIAIIATASTLLTPYKLSLFSFLTSYKNTAYLKMISEWLPQFYFPFMYWQLLYIGIFCSILIIWLFFSHNEKKLSLWNFSLSILFLFLAIKSKRHFPLFFIVTLPFLVNYLYHDFKILFINKEQKNKTAIKKDATKFIINLFLSITIISISVLLFINTKFNNLPFNSFCHKYPCQAVEFLKNSPEYKNNNIFNNYAWGGYLIYTYPEKKLFIDGRLPQKQINNHSYIEEYLMFFSISDQELRKKINEYDISLFLLEKGKSIQLSWIDKNIFGLKEERFNNKNNLIEFLSNSMEWIIIYEDNISIIFFKNF